MIAVSLKHIGVTSRDKVRNVVVTCDAGVGSAEDGHILYMSVFRWFRV